MLVEPRMRLDRDTTVSVDARRAKPVDITAPDPAAENTSEVEGFSARVELSPRRPADDRLVLGAADLRGDLPFRSTECILDNGVKWSIRARQMMARARRGTPRT
ncbi:hypothetical protein [Streptomyces sp. NPDC098781]|uniref:hypothetical protein n=1 Tax=Streptomyces sp. NPDC098781 TaxID=3366097 RepID=UPI00380F01B1